GEGVGVGAAAAVWMKALGSIVLVVSKPRVIAYASPPTIAMPASIATAMTGAVMREPSTSWMPRGGLALVCGQADPCGCIGIGIGCALAAGGVAIASGTTWGSWRARSAAPR